MTIEPIDAAISLPPSTGSTGTPASTRQLFALAGSAFGVLAAQPLYVLVDTAVVGHLGAHALASLGVGAALMTLVIFGATFVEYGTTSRAARWFGAGDRRAAVNEGIQASWLALLLGVLLVAGGEIFAGPLTRALAGGDGAEAAAALSWFRIAVIGIPGTLLVLAGNGWMRGVQQTRTPLVIVLVANGLSAVASPVLVYSLHLGLNGSAIANLGAQAVAAVWFSWALVSAATANALSWWRLQWLIVRAQLRVGRDLIVRAAGFQAAFLSAAAVAARMGTAQLGAHQVALQLWVFGALLLDSFAIAAQSLVGAALGGSDVTAARRLARQTGRYGLIVGVLFGVVLAACWSILPAAFTSSASVQHQLHVLWPWFVGMQPVAGVVFALDGVLIGAGDLAFLRTITLISAVGVFLPINLAALHWHWGIGGVWAGLTGLLVARLIGVLLRTRGTRWAVAGASR